ncbi:TPA: hypothetical protein ACOEQH_000467 [Stenotrophomonas maltophilia]
MSTDKTLADVQPGGRVRLGDQAELDRLEFQAWAHELLPCPFCGNGAEFVPYKDNGLTLKCKSMGCIQRNQRTLRYGIDWLRTSMAEHWNTRALSAQPSPGGQDALLDQARKLFDELGAIADDYRCVAILAAALAARQPVGEPVCSGGFVIANGSGEKYMAWGQVGPEWTADRSAALWLVRRADAEALAAENEDAWSILPVERCALPPNGWACTLAAGHEGPCPTIAAPPAQAVDLAPDHRGMRVSCSGLLSQVRGGLKSNPELAEMVRQLHGHLNELGKRWYAGDRKVVDEFLQLYVIEDGARRALIDSQAVGK